jgi:hypothetical protein
VLSAALQLAALGLMAGVAIPRLDFPLWLACFLAIGSLYGGGFGVLPAALSDLFGPRLSAATHGTMLGIWALSVVVGVPIFAAVSDALSAVPPGAAPGAARVPTARAYAVNATWLALAPAAALGAALLLTVRREDSTKIYDRATGEVTYGRIPSGSVVVSGNLPSADGKYSLYCAVIVKRVDAQTRAKTSLNDLLRD